MLIIFDLDDTLYNKDEQLGDFPSKEDFTKISVYPGVNNFLNSFKATKIMVSKGKVHLQNFKMKILGIDKLFDEIIICQQDKDKEKCFLDVLTKYGQNSENNEDKKNIFVVGDRIDSEIYYGNKLGLVTIRLKKGKYKSLKPKRDLEKANYEINEFKELNHIFKKMEV